MAVILELLREKGVCLELSLLAREEGCDLTEERMSYVLVLAISKLRF